jgi:WD40 repeat protein
MRRAPVVEFEPITCAWRPDGKQIAIGGTAGEVALWEPANGRMQRVAAHLHQFALSLAYRPDSTELWVTGIGGVPERITHLDGTPRVTPALPALGVVNALRFTPDGRFVVTGDALNVQVLDARTLAPVTDRIPATTNQIVLVVVSPDGHFAVASDFAGHMRRVDLRAGRAIGPPLGVSLPGLGAFGQDNSTVYASSSDNRATVWNFAPDHVRDEACAVAGRNLTQQEWHTYLPWAGPRRATCPQYA